MTHSPTFDQQLALDAYWRAIGGQTMLPGTNRAADRFVRASYYMETVKKSDDTNEALATALSVIRNVSVPVGISALVPAIAVPPGALVSNFTFAFWNGSAWVEVPSRASFQQDGSIKVDEIGRAHV